MASEPARKTWESEVEDYIHKSHCRFVNREFSNDRKLSTNEKLPGSRSEVEEYRYKYGWTGSGKKAFKCSFGKHNWECLQVASGNYYRYCSNHGCDIIECIAVKVAKSKSNRSIWDVLLILLFFIDLAGVIAILIHLPLLFR